jgi:hypothetical protein
MRRLKQTPIGATLLLVVACCSFAGTAPAATPPASTQVLNSEEIVYGNDGHVAMRCTGPTADLHYLVFYPNDRKPHPVVFGMTGTGFGGSANCRPRAKLETYRDIDGVMQRWAAAGFVAVNIEYHGAGNGVFGDLGYPGVGNWAGVADGTVQMDVKPAMQNFLAHDASRFHADERLGLVVFGTSSGAHNAYMVGATGLPGHHISAVIGWSGLPSAQFAGSYAEHVFDSYMRTTAGSDVESFGDPLHRLRAEAPAQYIANGLTEFIDSRTARVYHERCRSLSILACWLRLPNTAQHADGYANYKFTGQSPELTSPGAQIGDSVQMDSISFAERYLST